MTTWLEQFPNAVTEDARSADLVQGDVVTREGWRLGYVVERSEGDRVWLDTFDPLKQFYDAADGWKRIISAGPTTVRSGDS